MSDVCKYCYTALLDEEEIETEICSVCKRIKPIFIREFLESVSFSELKLEWMHTNLEKIGFKFIR